MQVASQGHCTPTQWVIGYGDDLTDPASIDGRCNTIGTFRKEGPGLLSSFALTKSPQTRDVR
jgi:hypothetical protein